jgi:GNAT superfamily N-acetyltransferase
MLRLEKASYITREDGGEANSRKYLWRIINHIQRDAVKKGILRSESGFGSFWNNLDDITSAAKHDKLYVAVNPQNHIIGYMVIGRIFDLLHPDSGILPLDIFEVLPRFRNKGNGQKMVQLLKDAAVSSGYCGIEVESANNSNGFWNKMGFTWPDDHSGKFICPIA